MLGRARQFLVVGSDKLSEALLRRDDLLQLFSHVFETFKVEVLVPLKLAQELMDLGEVRSLFIVLLSEVELVDIATKVASVAGSLVGFRGLSLLLYDA